MKKIFCVYIVLIALCGCGPSPEKRPASPLEEWMHVKGKLRVLSTTAMIDDIVGKIGGERVAHLPLIAGEIDPHSYELVKGDDEKLAHADLIFYNGLGLEHGASLRYRIQTHARAVALGDAVLAAHPDQILYVDGQIDPHIWMDIALWSEIIAPLVRALEKADPEGADVFRRNALAIQQQMHTEHHQIYSDLQRIPEDKRYLVTSHDAFNYFTRAYLATKEETRQQEWQPRFEAPEGLAPDGQLSAGDIQKIIAHLATYKIEVIFPESNVSRDSLNKIVHACRAKGLKVRISSQVLYGDAMGPNGGDADTYLKMIRHDAEAMISAWQAVPRGVDEGR